MRRGFRDRAFRVFAVLDPCTKERSFAAWLHGEMAAHGVKRTRKTVYNWLSNAVDIPLDAWMALDEMEAEAIRSLKDQIRRMK